MTISQPFICGKIIGQTRLKILEVGLPWPLWIIGRQLLGQLGFLKGGQKFQYQTIQANGMKALVRVSKNEEVIIKRV